MNKRFDKNAILALANDLYTDSLIATVARNEIETQPKKLLAGFIVSTVEDLYSPNSPDDANLERIASALDHSSGALGELASGIRRERRG